ncbi:TIGR03619 family F420-dependent LLM class oxidoreductase [Nocardia panacis]|uniref:TIGR03619 family F420-dependent LLM class oxidoreductase n=1 Tax=Nocardia panacis TaxID=2340916 RepID=A0A3A4K1P2_9NOCA|nr:TIGR03619 family F420-dependent LLM class oxidoreductase [Nocardia panacis]RJO78348.1 TIGR03619 family F420-dependent LLM class oxidoreductase [Nocardia panacis]
MRLGLALPQYGIFADPKAIVAVATRAEAEGFDSLWVGDRILVPTHPSAQYPGGAVPPGFRRFLDPLTVLTVAAGVTEHARLGTNTLNALWQPPLLLARTLTSLDHVSGGRLDVGLGLGWSPDEYEAVGVPWAGRGARLEETVDIFEAAWTHDLTAHQGPLWTVPEGRIEVKPLQTPRPPILFGGFAPAVLERVGRRGDGWLAGPVPPGALAAMWATVGAAAERHHRDPAALRLVVRVNPSVERAPEDQVPRRGSVDQIADYIAAIAPAGATEVVFDLQQTATDLDQLIDLSGQLKEAVNKRV